VLDELIKSIEKISIIKKGEYNYFVHPISSGNPEIKPEILREIVAFIKKKANTNIDKIVCIEAMGIHLATALSLDTDTPIVIIRKKEQKLPGEVCTFQKTSYSESKLYINTLKKGDKILLIDDVISSGGTYMAVIKALQNMGVEIVEALAVFEKGEHGKTNVEKETGIKIMTILKLNIK
jgi:adenine phosphoribosyltransferase